MAQSSEEDRMKVSKGVRTAVILTGSLYFTGYYVFPANSYQFKTMADKLAFTLRWQSFPILTFLFGILNVAGKRFRTTAIDPTAGVGDHQFAVDRQYLQNTLEQFVLSVSGQLILSTYLDESLTRVIPTLVMLFVTGRLLFWYGYHKHPLRRSVGFGMTFFPSVITHLTNVFYFIYYGQYGIESN